MKQKTASNSKSNNNQLVPSLVAGLVSGLIVSIVGISFAGLIFAGDLYRFMSNGIGFMLFGSFLTGIIYIFFTSFRGSINVLQGTAAALIGVEVAIITADMWGVYSDQEIFLTVVATVLFTTVLTGVFSYVLGSLHLGSLVRYLPYPVMGGFLAGSGWLLFLGGFNLLAKRPLVLNQLGALFAADFILRWLPGIIFAVFLFIILRKFNHFLIMPGLIISAFILFFAILFASGSSLEEASTAGWFLGPFSEPARFQFATFALFQKAQWGLIFSRTLNFSSVILISIISFLLNVSGIDLGIREDIDLNQELRAVGIVDIITGFVGAQAGMPAVGLSLLGYRMRANGVWTALVSASVPAVLLFFGAPILPFLPRIVMGSIVLWLGISLMYEWLIEAYVKLPLFEYLIVWTIVIVMSTAGLLEGIGVGLVLATLLFAINYARIDVVKHYLNASTYRSTVDRPLAYQRLLGDHGDWLYILELQGYIFFGTASTLYLNVKERLDRDSEEELRYLVFDFRQVVGMDASAVMEFKKVHTITESTEIQVVFTHMSSTLRSVFENEKYLPFAENSQKLFEDLDRGVEWCEDRQLDKYIDAGLVGHRRDAVKAINVSEEGRHAGQLSALLDFLGEREKAVNIPLVKTLSDYLERVDFVAGDIIIQQGEYTRGLFFLEEGEATAFLENDDRQNVRLRKMVTGAVMGEVSYYRRDLSSASVRADSSCEIYILSRANISEIDKNEPELSRELHRFMAQLLSYRLATSTNTIRALMG